MANKNRRRARQPQRTTAPVSDSTDAVAEAMTDTSPRRRSAPAYGRALSARLEWQGPLDLRRIGVFILFAFGIAWSVAAYIYWTGGLMDRSPDDTLFGLPTVLLLIAVVYMGAPTFANLLTRLVTREPWTIYGWN